MIINTCIEFQVLTMFFNETTYKSLAIPLLDRLCTTETACDTVDGGIKTTKFTPVCVKRSSLKALVLM